MPNKKDLLSMSTITVLLITSILGLMPESTDTHVCVEDNETMYCDHLSGSGRTCYPNPDTRQGSNLCSGEWKPILREETPDTNITRIKLETNDGVMIECDITDNILRKSDYCYYNEEKHFRSEFT